MNNKVIIRNALNSDHNFILSLSPYLSEVAKLDWHTEKDIEKMQDNYIINMLAPTDEPSITLIAEVNGSAVGFIHVRTNKDSISGETCGTVPLLAISPDSQGGGVGKKLIQAAEQWTKALGYRLLHLEVFANNDKAANFYQHLGFQPETLHMIKPLT